MAKLNGIRPKITLLGLVDPLVLHLTPSNLNEIQFALQHSSFVEDVSSLFQIFSHGHAKTDPKPNVDGEAQVGITAKPATVHLQARVKFAGFCIGATSTFGSSIVLDTRVFEFSIGIDTEDSPQNIDIKAEVDPIIYFGDFDKFPLTDPKVFSTMAYFETHIQVRFEKTTTCPIKVPHERSTCSTCIGAKESMAVVVRFQAPSLFLPPDVLRSIVQLTLEFEQARLDIQRKFPAKVKKATDKLRDRLGKSLATATHSQENVSFKFQVDSFLARMPLLPRFSSRRQSVSSTNRNFLVRDLT